MKTETIENFFNILSFSILVVIAVLITMFFAFGGEINVFEVPPMANITLPLYEMAGEKAHRMFIINDIVIDIAYNK